MPIAPLVVELLQQVIDSGRSAEEVCKDRPELLGEVRLCLRELMVVQNELDALFPPNDEGRLIPSPGLRPEIPGYAVLEVLGRGGMGVVYKARHLRLNRPVAVKMMLSGGFAGPPELARFQQEAEALAALEHPNIIRVYDVGEVGGLPYFTMEFVDGGNLAQKLGGTPQPARAAAALMANLAGAVEAAHRGGIVHRDLKPSNILLSADGTPKITDFGLARRFEAGAGLTMTGVRIGTPGYMAPEQAAGQARVSGPATDVYALGAILYEMLTGRPPFLAESTAETERQVIAEEPAPPSHLNAKVPRDLETICLKCLQKAPLKRYRSAAEMGEDLERYLRGDPIKARPVGSIERASKWVRRHPAQTVTLSGGLLILVAIVVGGWWLISARSSLWQAVEGDLSIATQSLRRSDWGEARSALERARGRLGRGGPRELRRRLDQGDRDLDLVGRLAVIRLERLTTSRRGVNVAGSAVAYEEAFRAEGLFDFDEPARVAADRLGRSAVKDALVAAVDDWALCAGYLSDAGREAWLLEMARRADPDTFGWRDRVRNPSMRRDKNGLARLIDSANLAEAPVNLLVSLGELFQRSGGDPVPFLLSVQREHPDDLWLSYLLGSYAVRRNDIPEALRNLQSALAIQPGTALMYHDLGHAFHLAGRRTESLSYLAKAVQLDPENARIRFNFSLRLLDSNRPAEALEQFERAHELTQDTSWQLRFWKSLRDCRMRLGQLDEAEALWRRILETKPRDHSDWDGYAELSLYLGHEEAYRSTSRALIEQFGSTEDAQVAERTGRACLLLPVSGEPLRKASELIDRALARKTPKPEWVVPYFMFAKGLAEYRQGRLESSITIMDGPASSALQSAPRLVSAMARHRLGRKEEALKTFALAILSSDWRQSRPDDREKWFYHVLRREAETMMLPNLRAFLDGNYKPRSKDEKLCMLGACQFEGQYRAAALIYSEVLTTDTHLADDLNAKTRYLAACMAASVGAGRRRETEGLDTSDRLRWRKQARDWLRADLDRARKLLEEKPPWLRDSLESTLKTWTTDPDLEGLRDAAACKELSIAEQKEFQSLSGDLGTLIHKIKN
jgi:tetratricopeptide (TPR) repeat protein